MSKKSDLLNVGVKKGTFYLSENAPKDDTWTKQEFKNPQTGEPMIKYHKAISIEGNLVYLAMRNDAMKGMSLNLILAGDQDSDDSYSLQIPIINANGSVKATNEYFNSLVGVLEKVEFGDKLKMFVNNRNEDKNGRLYRNIVVLDQDGKLIKSEFSFKDVPNWESTTTTDDFGNEVKVWNPSPANKFYIARFKAITDRWEAERLARKSEKEAEKNETANQPKDEKPKNAVPTATPSEAFGNPPVAENFDDLPF